MRIGADAKMCEPDMFFCDTRPNAIYLLCTDGFRHELSAQELMTQFNPATLTTKEKLTNREVELIDYNKHSGETDNISVISVRTCL